MSSYLRTHTSSSGNHTHHTPASCYWSLFLLLCLWLKTCSFEHIFMWINETIMSESDSTNESQLKQFTQKNRGDQAHEKRNIKKVVKDHDVYSVPHYYRI